MKCSSWSLFVLSIVISIGASDARGELMFSSGSGEVRVTQEPISSDWVNVSVEAKLPEVFYSFAGGFRTMGDAEFSQRGGDIDSPEDPFDTAFVVSEEATGDPLIFGKVDDSSELLTTGFGRLNGDFGPAGEFLPFAQLVLAPGASVETVSDDGELGPIGFALGTGEVFAELSGTLTAVPEPSSLMLFGMALFGFAGYRIIRRRRVAG